MTGPSWQPSPRSVHGGSNRHFEPHRFRRRSSRTETGGAVDAVLIDFARPREAAAIQQVSVRFLDRRGMHGGGSSLLQVWQSRRLHPRRSRRVGRCAAVSRHCRDGRALSGSTPCRGTNHGDSARACGDARCLAHPRIALLRDHPRTVRARKAACTRRSPRPGLLPLPPVFARRAVLGPLNPPAAARAAR